MPKVIIDADLAEEIINDNLSLAPEITKEIASRIANDVEFQQMFSRNPAEALKQYSLSREDVAAFESAFRVRLPGFLSDEEEIGLGDVIK